MRKIIVYTSFLSAVACMIWSCQNASDIELTTYITNGKDLYKKYCQNCHGVQGNGLGELYPPLTDSVFLKLNKAQLACYIKNGSNQKLVIHGKTYETKMPGFKQLEDIDIAQLIVYITNSFGNKQGVYKYEQVASDLTKCK